MHSGWLLEDWMVVLQLHPITLWTSLFRSSHQMLSAK